MSENTQNGVSTPNWSEYFNQTQDIIDNGDKSNKPIEGIDNGDVIEQSIVHATLDDDEPTVESEDKRRTLSSREFKTFCDRMTGFLETGESKALLNYQAYYMLPGEEVPSDPQSSVVYDIHGAVYELSFDELNPDIMVVTIKFKSFSDTELRLLWARIQKWRTTMSAPLEGDKLPIFVLHFLERESLGDLDKGEIPTILECNIINPLLAYITREVPTAEAIDIVNEKDEHMGGNVIKLLCSTEFATFTLRNDIDTTAIKAEILREEEEERYINASPLFVDDNDAL